MSRPLITHERLKELLHYDPGTGVFTNRINRGRGASAVRAGDVAGSEHDDGRYIKIQIDGRGYQAGRLAWFYMLGVWPPEQTDHEDLDGTNNRFANLRSCSGSRNHANVARRKDNTSGFKGRRLVSPGQEMAR